MSAEPPSSPPTTSSGRTTQRRTFKIAEVLVNDDHDLIHKAVSGWVREAGKRDPDGLLDFLDRFAATMPRTALRYAVEHLDKTQRDHYMGLKQA